MASILEFTGTIESKRQMRAKDIGCTTDFRKALMAVTILKDYSKEERKPILDDWFRKGLLSGDEHVALETFYKKGVVEAKFI